MSDTANYNYFYADYVSGDALPQKDGGSHNVPSEIAENNYGYDDLLDITPVDAKIIVNSNDNALGISSCCQFVSEWTVGGSFASNNRAYNSLGQVSGVFSDGSPAKCFEFWGRRGAAGARRTRQRSRALIVRAIGWPM